MKKTLILAAAFAALAGGTAIAQNGGPPGGGRMGRGGPGGPGMDRALLKDIALTDAQKAKLEQLRAADREQMQAQMQQGGGRGGPDMQAIRDAREKGDTATANRLMAEQR